MDYVENAINRMEDLFDRILSQKSPNRYQTDFYFSQTVDFAMLAHDDYREQIRRTFGEEALEEYDRALEEKAKNVKSIKPDQNMM